MENMKNEIKDKGQDLMKDFKNQIQTGEKQLEKMSQNAGEKAGAMASNLMDSSNEYYKTSQKYVQDNPMKGIAIAALAGIVAGSLVTLAMRKRH